jgi:nucleotide-binding universal stress UspA family protein
MSDTERRKTMSTYRIVVGVDGSEGGQRALRWAVHEAVARNGSVQVITAWAPAVSDTPTATTREEQRRSAVAAQERTLEAVAIPAGVSVATEVVQGRPADVLTSAAFDADLLVLGSHGHGRLHQAALGSVSDACVRKVGCPVVVLPVPHQLPAPARDPAVRGAATAQST